MHLMKSENMYKIQGLHNTRLQSNVKSHAAWKLMTGNDSSGEIHENCYMLSTVQALRIN